MLRDEPFAKGMDRTDIGALKQHKLAAEVIVAAI
jgi:hypothetical protein